MSVGGGAQQHQGRFLVLFYAFATKECRAPAAAAATVPFVRNLCTKQTSELGQPGNLPPAHCPPVNKHRAANGSLNFPRTPQRSSVAFHQRRHFFSPARPPVYFCLEKLLFSLQPIKSQCHYFHMDFSTSTCKTNKCGEVPPWLLSRRVYSPQNSSGFKNRV